MATALVLAGNSFVGRHLAGTLPWRGVEVVATARSPVPGYVPCDLTDFKQVAAVVADTRPDWIISCAGATASKSRDDMDRLHVGGTLNLIQALARHVPEAVLVLFGSAAEYGDVAPDCLPIREDCPARPQSAFGQSKLAQFQAALEGADAWKLRIVVVRPFNIIGPGLPEHYLPAALARRLSAALADKPHRPRDSGMVTDSYGRGLFPLANGQATRDWVDVRDVVEAVIGLLAHAVPARGKIGLYNIASGLETSVLALGDKLCRLAGDFKAVAGDSEPSRSSIIRSCGDAIRLRQAIGWAPRISWQQSLEDLWREAKMPVPGRAA